MPLFFRIGILIALIYRQERQSIMTNKEGKNDTANDEDTIQQCMESH